MDNEDAPYSHSVYIASLIYKVQEKDSLTEKEREDLEAWKKEDDLHAGLYTELQDRDMLVDELRMLTNYDTPGGIKTVFHKLGIRPTGKVRKMPIAARWAVAAAVLLILLGSVVLFTVNKRTTPAIVAHKSDIAPGRDQAVLTLADGSTIVMDSVHNGQIALQQSATISRQNGQLVYITTPNSKTATMAYNTMATPKGGQFTVVLPDGSKVMLNAASSVRYPTVFAGDDRTVELSGEAYFEVAKNNVQPFIVKTRTQDIKVLGTSFDIMAYADEPDERTTLVSGAVQVSRGAQTKVLAPGQQASADNSGTGLTIVSADVDKETAWTTGFFKFDHTDIHTIMREISRWYDIEVVYETKIADADTYSGRISRRLPLSDLVTFLESNGVHHFRIEGRRLTIFA